MTDTTWPPPWTLKPTISDPVTTEEFDGDDNPMPDSIHWSIGFGFARNVGHGDTQDDTTPLTISAHFSDDDLARGFVKREVRPAQLDEFARLLLNIAAKQRAREAGR